MAGLQFQSSGMLSREQLVYLFDRFSELTAQPDVKRRISDAVDDKQEAVAVTTALQEGIFLEMEVDPSFGISCLGKVNTIYENDRDLMIQFYKFVASEEMACDEAELGTEEYAKKLHNQQMLQGKASPFWKTSFAFILSVQLEMLKYMRKFHLDDQSTILDKLRQNLENANFDEEASVLPTDQIQETVRRRVSPLFMPAN
ncbi:unnamed protein product [Linum tenue]|uniref:Uncharacterized protein n=1 Tax=Linum tenue TaxID=586396 RepID=A0AAV0NGM3_9ROSI|nr:unnamed protein product [Linum tenue]